MNSSFAMVSPLDLSVNNFKYKLYFKIYIILHEINLYFTF